MDSEQVQSWTAEELVRNVYHYLNQHSSITLGCLDVLFQLENRGEINEDRKKLLAMLQREANHIRFLNDVMGDWIRTHHP